MRWLLIWCILCVPMLTYLLYAVRLHRNGKAGGVTYFLGTLAGVVCVWITILTAELAIGVSLLAAQPISMSEIEPVLYIQGLVRLLVLESPWIGLVVFAHLMEQRSTQS